MKKIKCSQCHSDDIAKKGFRYNKSGKKQKYRCCDCKAWFIFDDGFKRMRFNPKTITKAVHQYIDGMSLFKAQYHLFQHDNVKVTRKTISKWTKKYSFFFEPASHRSKSKIKRSAAFR